MLLYLPDSPRWFMMRGLEEEAKDLLARLADADIDSEVVGLELSNIKEALAAQSSMGGFKMCELLTNGPSQNLRRTLLGIAAQFFQQICGINLIISEHVFLQGTIEVARYWGGDVEEMRRRSVTSMQERGRGRSSVGVRQ